MRLLRLLALTLGTSGLVLLAALALVALGHGPTQSWDRLGTVTTGSADPDLVLPAALALLAWGCVVWLALGVLLGALGALPGAVGSAADAVATRVTPAAVRRLGRLAVGAALVTGTVGAALPASAGAVPTTAGPAASSWADLDWQAPTAPPASTAPAVEAGPAATSPAAPAAAAAPVVRAEPTALSTPARPQPSETAAEVVVVRGDTLWSLAARTLGPGATDSEIGAEWQRWYETNREVIGADPDLLQPGQRLAPPT